MSNSSASDCIFCKIVNGDIPAHRIYEDADFLVFLDAFPAHKGHTLIIPKQHYQNIFDLPSELAGKVMHLGQKIAIAIEQALDADGYNFLQNNKEQSGQEVMHYHLHLIPRFQGQGPKGAKNALHPAGFEYQPDTEELVEIADRISQAL